MAAINELVEGLQILAKYEAHGLETHINGADHDVIYGRTAEVSAEQLDEFYSDPERYDGDLELVDVRMSAEDSKRMNELGWFIDGDNSAWTHYC